MSVTASAPGSMMVIGEHAVVLGAPALVAAIEQRAQVHVEGIAGDTVELHSQIAPPLETRLGTAPGSGPYRFLLAAINASGVDRGVRITTSSQIDPTMGLGSSAAVTIAALGALSAFLGRKPNDVHQRALSIVRAIQGRGSGADLAASLCGGLTAYALRDTGLSADMEVMPSPPVIALKYVGYKTPTAEVLSLVGEAAEKRPNYYNRIYEAMRHCASEGVAAAKTAHWEGLAKHM
ncbi:MAG: mevalonate kinase, partial [Pseudomonadota bacterium]